MLVGCPHHTLASGLDILSLTPGPRHLQGSLDVVKSTLTTRPGRVLDTSLDHLPPWSHVLYSVPRPCHRIFHFRRTPSRPNEALVNTLRQPPTGRRRWQQSGPPGASLESESCSADEWAPRTLDASPFVTRYQAPTARGCLRDASKPQQIWTAVSGDNFPPGAASRPLIPCRLSRLSVRLATADPRLGFLLQI